MKKIVATLAASAAIAGAGVAIPAAAHASPAYNNACASRWDFAQVQTGQPIGYVRQEMWQHGRSVGSGSYGRAVWNDVRFRVCGHPNSTMIVDFWASDNWRVLRVNGKSAFWAHR